MFDQEFELDGKKYYCTHVQAQTVNAFEGKERERIIKQVCIPEGDPRLKGKRAARVTQGPVTTEALSVGPKVSLEDV